MRQLWRDLVIDFGVWGALGVLLISPLIILIALAVKGSSWLWKCRRIITNAFEVLVMIAKRESVWAIGFQGYVELRSSKKAPRRFKTEMEREGEQTVLEAYQDKRGRNRLRPVRVPLKFCLSNTIYQGGRVLKVVNARAFYYSLGRRVGAGELLKLTKTQAVKILGKRSGYD